MLAITYPTSPVSRIPVLDIFGRNTPTSFRSYVLSVLSSRMGLPGSTRPLKIRT